MKTSSARYVFFGQIGYLGALLICVLLLPKGLAANDGFCFYGSKWRTAVPYMLGLIALAWFYFKAAQALPSDRKSVVIKYSIYGLLLLLIPAAETPFKFSTSFHTEHVILSIVIFVLQVSIAIYFVFMFRWDWLNIVLLSLLGLLALFAAASVYPKHGFLLQIETAFQLTFATLFVRSVSFLETSKSSRRTPLLVLFKRQPYTRI
jgi:hypothetical protein